MVSQTKSKSGTSNRSEQARSASQDLPQEPTLGDVAEQTVHSLRAYAKERPDVLAMWCFGLGFVVGWKLKPW